jgi:hypothetical protein
LLQHLNKLNKNYEDSQNVIKKWDGLLFGEEEKTFHYYKNYEVVLDSWKKLISGSFFNIEGVFHVDSDALLQQVLLSRFGKIYKNKYFEEYLKFVIMLSISILININIKDPIVLPKCWLAYDFCHC